MSVRVQRDRCGLERSVVVDRELGGREKSVGGQWSAVVDKGTGCGVCTV